MKIFVRRERVDPVVTSQSGERDLSPQITEEELNSEVELLKSRDLLAEIVAAHRLHERQQPGLRTRLKQMFAARGVSAPDNERIARAVVRFEDDLTVQPLRKASIIRVAYASPDPVLSANVLETLARKYLEKHLAVHRAPRAFAFFQQETERYRAQLAGLQQQLADSGREHGVVAAGNEKEAALRQIAELGSTGATMHAQIAETATRVNVLAKQLAATSPRIVTEIRTVSARLVEQLQSTLSPLELKRIELLQVFQPQYGPVREVEEQIAKIKSTIAAASRAPLVEETTDRNPTHAFLQTELARARAELAALNARQRAVTETLTAAQDKARRLDVLERHQRDLVREIGETEQHYLVYHRKQEEARIADALDARGIVNVAVAEHPTVPVDPVGPRRLLLLFGGVGAAGLLSVLLALVWDYRDPAVRTPDDIRAFLELPVLASLPRTSK